MTSPQSEKQKSSVSVKSARSFGSLRENPFASSYASICAKYKVRPVPCVKVNYKTNSVAVHGGRMKDEEWQVAMEALSTDVTTHRVRIDNKRNAGKLAIGYDNVSGVSSVMEAQNRRTPSQNSCSYTSFRSSIQCKNVPAADTVVGLIAWAVHELLINSPALVCLELEHVRLDERALEVLVSGVQTNRTLQHLSLAHSRIGDAGSAALCRVLRDQPNVLSVNLSGCCLTATAVASSSSSVHGLMDVVKKQQIRRNEECWAHSLRYRTADPATMRGLRRLTLNSNRALGDDGVAELFETLKDDYYVKAVDLQDCGLTDRGARLAADLLAVNDTLMVLDVRHNEHVSPAALVAVMARLRANHAGNLETDRWTWTRTVAVARDRGDSGSATTKSCSRTTAAASSCSSRP